jgi:serine/threonine-protein phosphatase 6 regulatory ankyrin repeat subunit B
MAKVNFSPAHGLGADWDLAAEIVAGGDFNIALIRASKKGHLEVVQALLGHNADPNAMKSDGFTALWLAAKGGHLEVVQALIGHDADPNQAQTSDGSTALMISSENGHLEVVQALFGHKADPNTAMATT